MWETTCWAKPCAAGSSSRGPWRPTSSAPSAVAMAVVWMRPYFAASSNSGSSFLSTELCGYVRVRRTYLFQQTRDRYNNETSERDKRDKHGATRSPNYEKPGLPLFSDGSPRQVLLGLLVAVKRRACLAVPCPPHVQYTPPDLTVHCARAHFLSDPHIGVTLVASTSKAPSLRPRKSDSLSFA